MTAPRLTPDELATIAEHATPAQHEAIALWAVGYGYRRIGTILGIHWTSARDRIIGGLAHVGLDLETLRR